MSSLNLLLAMPSPAVPCHMFFYQVVVTIIAGTVQLGMQAWNCIHHCMFLVLLRCSLLLITLPAQWGIIGPWCLFSQAPRHTVLQAYNLFGWYPSTTCLVSTAQEVQVQIPQVSQLLAYFHQYGQLAAHNTPQLCCG